MSRRTQGSVLIEADDTGAETGRQRRLAPAALTGLCSNCVHAQDCAYRRFADRPVVHCEEWSAGNTREEPAGERGRPEAAAAGAVEPEPRPPGLCATCEEYPYCTFDKPPSGVWHCEEYR